MRDEIKFALTVFAVVAAEVVLVGGINLIAHEDHIPARSVHIEMPPGCTSLIKGNDIKIDCSGLVKR